MPDRLRIRHYSVSAVDLPLPMLAGTDGKAYVLASDEAVVKSGHKKPEPLVLHVSVGDCIKVNLANHTSAGAISYHCDLLAYDPSDSGGIAVGNDPAQSVLPGDHRIYTYFASPSVGETVSLGRDWGDVLHNPGLDLYGAIVVGPPGSQYRDPGTGRDLAGESAAAVDVIRPPDRPIATSACSSRSRTQQSVPIGCRTPRRSMARWQSTIQPCPSRGRPWFGRGATPCCRLEWATQSSSMYCPRGANRSKCSAWRDMSGRSNRAKRDRTWCHR